MSEVSSSSSGGGKQQDGKVRSKKSSTKIDMTPMVDLAFLLLTFFMLATTFNKPQTMEITLPEKPKVEDQQPLINERKVLTVVLDEQDKIYWYVGITEPSVQLTNFSKDGIRKVLAQQKSAISQMVVLIKPTDQSRYANIVDILDEMSIGNIERFAIVDVTAEDLSLIHSSVNPIGK